MRCTRLLILAFIFTLYFSHGTSKPDHKAYKKWYKKVVAHCKPGTKFKDLTNRSCVCTKPGHHKCKQPKSSKSSDSDTMSETIRYLKEFAGYATNKSCSDGPIPRSWIEDCNTCVCPDVPILIKINVPICTLMDCGIFKTSKALKKQQLANRKTVMQYEMKAWAENCEPGTQRKNHLGCNNFCKCVERGVVECEPLMPCRLKKTSPKKPRSQFNKGIEEFAHKCKAGEKRHIKYESCKGCPKSCNLCTCVKPGEVVKCVVCKDQ